ncbi:MULTISPECIES: glycosyltransferase family 9 protein [Streptomyces]|uniref:glycosyltransferase family 9 protein n=1 Tax=Streptomyces TaxID=1883 RepID=UPI0023B8DF2B|nr:MULTISPECIES: glycosyltransferase family 9 protein [unclassified Streptomyces]MDT0424273.1 glycosyltransferase family 9 protein [Streptomyces sp. DSM 41859]WEH31249.1 glycosyltransferase family 9 protein [Streptomyces sp. AM 3-1-1]
MPPSSPPPTTLVLRALGLGDLLAGVPALRALRRARPDHRLVLAAPPALREAAHASGAVDELFPAEAPGRGVPDLRHWPGPAPALAVDLHGTGPESHRALAALSPARLLSYSGPRPPASPPRGDDHERVLWCRLLTAHGIPADPADLLLTPPTARSPAPGAVVVHPGANAPAREWPAERYAEVIRALRADGRRVVITGGPDEKDLVARLGRAAGIPDDDLFPGTLSFGTLAALLSRAALLLSSDTGPAHLAVACATPSVTLFGPVPPWRWGPPEEPRHAALWHPGPPGDPHGRTPDRQLLCLTVPEVLIAVRNRLAAPLERGGHG